MITRFAAASLIALAAATALSTAAPTAAQDRHDCIDGTCTIESIRPQDPAPAATAAAARYARWGFDLAGINKNVKPGIDWFAYVNETWVKTTQIPADRSSYGAFAVLRDLSEARLERWSRVIAPTTRPIPTAPR